MNARQEAKQLRGKCRLSGRADVVAVAELLGLRVDEWPLPVNEVHEVFVKDSIGVATEASDADKRWAIAHGIGHYILHSAGNQVWLRAHTGLSDKLERQAEDFAYHLTVDMSEAWDEGLETAGEIAEFFGIPPEMVRVQGRLV